MFANSCAFTQFFNVIAKNGLKITDGEFTSRHGVISLGGGEGIIEGGSYTIQFKAAITSNVVYVYGSGELTIESLKVNKIKSTFYDEDLVTTEGVVYLDKYNLDLDLDDKQLKIANCLDYISNKKNKGISPEVELKNNTAAQVVF